MSNNKLKRPTDIFICSHTMAISLKKFQHPQKCSTINNYY